MNPVAFSIQPSPIQADQSQPKPGQSGSAMSPASPPALPRFRGAAPFEITITSLALARRQRQLAVQKDYGQGITGHQVHTVAHREEQPVLAQRNKEARAGYDTKMEEYRRNWEITQGLPWGWRQLIQLALRLDRPTLKPVKSAPIDTEQVYAHFTPEQKPIVTEALEGLDHAHVIALSQDGQSLTLNYQPGHV